MARLDPRKLKQDAQAALDKGKFKKAVELYLKLEMLEPKDGQWARRAGEMFRRLGKRQEAILAFERAAGKYMDEGFLVKSIAVCKMILQLDPEHSMIRDQLAALNASRGIAPGEHAPEHAPLTLEQPSGSYMITPAPAVPKVTAPAPAMPKPVAPAPTVTKPVAPAPTVTVRPGSAVARQVELAPMPVSAPATPAAPAASEPGAIDSLSFDLADMSLSDIELAPMGADTGPATPTMEDDGDEELDLAALAAMSMRALDGGEGRSSARPAAVTPPRPPVPPRLPRPPTVPPELAAAHGKATADREGRRKRPRTVPPDAPLEVVDLGSVVPGATELDDAVMSEGVIEIPLDDIDFEEAPAETTTQLRESETQALQNTPLLSSLGPDAMQHLISTVELVDLAPGQVLFREGDEGRTLYVIAEGSVSVISEGPPRTRLSTLHEGDFFGEIAIVTNQARNATIEADAERGAHLLAIDRNVIGDLVDEEPGVLQAILRFLRDRLVSRLIQTSPLFAPFTGPDSRELAGKFRFLEVASGARIIEQGKRAPGLFVLLAGKLEALREDDGQVRRMGTLEPGGVCGEVSLLAGQAALFSIQATSKCFLLQLPAQVFLEVIMTHPQVLVFVSDLADERRARYQAILAGDADYESGRLTFV